MIDLADPEKEPLMPVAVRGEVAAYLAALPGFATENGHKQSQTTRDQHSFLQMQFTRILDGLDEVYGHIFQMPQDGVDMTDLTENRRIEIFMLPDKSEPMTPDALVSFFERLGTMGGREGESRSIRMV
jgi:intracellular multiplication protein IcmO